MPADQVLHELPMRWADLDSLNHVNNVVYVDYAAESRALLIADGLVPDRPASRVTVRFVRPLLLSRRPVTIVSTIDGEVITQEICVEREGTRTVFAEVVSVLGESATVERHEPVLTPFPARIRRSDVDVTGMVSATKVFELFQESRVLLLADGAGTIAPGRFVVGTVDVSYVRPIIWRPEPYDVRNWLSRIGGSSLTIESELSNGDTVLARATSVLVGFDLPSQRSRTLSDQEKAHFVALLG
ncbi:acyl-CoA thioesterase [Aeromicrobium sp.]|uniref:acyl-CoA thioesterase n=1 Tax=Aeromicrobium sp. TaxID=1871063 RepID=UPI003C3175D0